MFIIILSQWRLTNAILNVRCDSFPNRIAEKFFFDPLKLDWEDTSMEESVQVRCCNNFRDRGSNIANPCLFIGYVVFCRHGLLCGQQKGYFIQCHAYWGQYIVRRISAVRTFSIIIFCAYSYVNLVLLHSECCTND